jgi:hypothetical protein
VIVKMVQKGGNDFVQHLYDDGRHDPLIHVQHLTRMANRKSSGECVECEFVDVLSGLVVE